MDQFKSNNPQAGSVNQKEDNLQPPAIDLRTNKHIITDSSQDRCYYKQDKWPSRIMACTTIVIAFITFFYMLAAFEQVKQMKETIKITERAWVGIHAVSAQVEIGKPIITTVEFINTGKTPAINLTTRAVGEAVVKNSPPDYTKEGYSIDSKGIVYPQQKIRISLKDSTQPPLNQVGFDQVEKGDALIYVHGRVNYSDVFGKDHWFTYCFLYEPDRKTVSAYKEHNDTDNN
jgi:hypothetical protein